MIMLLTSFRLKNLPIKCFRHFSNVPKKRVGFLGVPFGRGQKEEGLKRKGLEIAPDAVRSSTLIKDLKKLGIDVKDFGNVSYKPLDSTVEVNNMCYYNHIIPNIEQVSEQVYNIIKDDRVCLTVGGDHSIFTGTLHGHLKANGEDNVAVVYVDAHADINTSLSSPTGSVHGMCVAMGAKELKQSWSNCPNLDWYKHRTSLKNLGYIGLRAVDPEEAKVIKDFDIAAYSSSDVTNYGISTVLKNVMQRIDPDNNKIIHLSIDTDSLDPSEAPSTTVPERGGLLLRELIYIAETLCKTNRIGAVDWVELNPRMGNDTEWNKTLQAAIMGILACFGNQTAGNLP